MAAAWRVRRGRWRPEPGGLPGRRLRRETITLCTAFPSLSPQSPWEAGLVGTVMCFSQIKKYRPREVVTLPKATQLVCKQQGQEWKPSESHSRAPKARDVDRFTHAPTRSFIQSIFHTLLHSFVQYSFIYANHLPGTILGIGFQ